MRHGNLKRSIDQKLRLRKFDARHEKIETGAVIKNRKGISGLEGGKEICSQWKEKSQSSKGEQCSFWHESNDRAQKPDHNAATPSEPTVSRSRSASKKRSIRGKSNHGSILRQPCGCCLRGTCTRTPSEYWHPPECQFYTAETGCKAGGTSVCSRIIRLKSKKRRKATIPTKEEKATTRMLWLKELVDPNEGGCVSA